MNHPFLKRLELKFPKGFFSVDPADLQEYGKDWTQVYAPAPLAICFPRSTEEVSKLLSLCFESDLAVVPSGGRTGLAGGAIAAHGEIVLSLSKMQQVGEVDKLSQSVWCQSGVVTEAMHEHARESGLTWPIDFASKGSSTVGGNIATNAGGVKVIRYGLTRNWVLGLTVVLMDGTILRLNGSLEKNNTGVDLRQVFIGTEGIMGVITECILKLAPVPGESDVFFFALSGLTQVFKLFEAARRSGFTINAFECLSLDCLRVVTHHRHLKSPFAGDHPYYVLCEVERPESENARLKLEAWLASLFESALVDDAVLAQSPKEAQNLWAMREGISEALAHAGLLHKHDISLPIGRLQEFIETWTHDLEKNYSGLQPYIFGHIGDGNLHVNLMKPEPMDVAHFRALCAKVDQNMFGWIQKFEGSVSAEHGIGLLKKHLLTYTRSPTEIELMKKMKSIFDAKGLLNPGKIF